MLFGLPASLNFLLAYLLWDKPTPQANNSLSFQLRHVHAISDSSRVVFADVPSLFTTADASDIRLKPTITYKPTSISSFHSSRRRRQPHSSVEWAASTVPGPDFESRETLLRLAKMTSNAYTAPNASDWYPLGDDFPDNKTYPFGWQPDADGFRGHVFVSSDNSTVIVSVKGTSAGWIVGGGGPTVKKDKLNDNLLFSCCCARVGPTWSPVCGCYKGQSRCDEDCVEDAMVNDSLFYSVGINLYNNITYAYPEANIWLIGHSLGGSLAALIGATFGAPVVAFEAPGDEMAARRLHLPPPPSKMHITHVLNTADSIAMGTCTGVTSSCAIGGYAMESRCHQGQVISYDTVTDLGWSVDVRSHGIKVVIDKVLGTNWWKGEEGREVPTPKVDADCVDCYSWEFFQGGNSTSRKACGQMSAFSA